MSAAASIAFTPLFPWWAITTLAALALALLIYGALRRASGLGFRFVAFAIALLILANPSLVEEQRRAVPDVVALVVDESESQRIGDRMARTEAAVADLQERLARLPGLEVRIARGGREAGGDGESTELFGPLGRALGDVPRSRVAGAILVTDGQVHDAPADRKALGFDAPLHVLLTGKENEGDRRLRVLQAPSFGLVGGDVPLTVLVEDVPKARPGAKARLSIARDAEAPTFLSVDVGTPTVVPITLGHAGTTLVDLSVDAGPEELTLNNNRALVAINGVLDRLRVLLISGEPHSGERVWRNLLKADPSVDLVHFTILRPPEKQDMTPVRELSLIAFPTRELFEQKLHEFHLIIFDRYRRRGLLPQAYVENVVEYVRKGGAVLSAAGAAFAGPLSLYRTALGDILPARPTGHVAAEGFKPRLTEAGARHPVTGDLPGADIKDPKWGRWFRQIEVEAIRGSTLLSGHEDRPVLVVDRVGEGRIAQLLSDHAWLWARGFEGGGPQAELLRRVAHWLMKEPDLEEEDLRARARGRRIEVERRSLTAAPVTVSVTFPSGRVEELRLIEQSGGRNLASMAVDETGLY
ncbi:MAG: hypothetical protein FJX47_15735, partial [Alphaproteobacteria bacterium]|nr:hypothetical protein [Alphaproteobacteria bacterium]